MKRFHLCLAILIAFAFVLPLAAVAGEEQEGMTKHYEDSILQITENGKYGIEVVVKGGELKKIGNQVDLIVHDKADKDVIGATVIVTPWMPDMGHGVGYMLKVEEKGGGLYQVAELDLPMSGKWELRVSVSKDGVEDKAVFAFDVGRAMHGKHTPQKVPADLDTSTELMAAKGRYKISYKVMTGSGAAPLNKIHSWELTVMTSDGKPVEGASVKVKGLMPEHGHGFPTKPQVTEDLGGGRYLVEGIKFSMPGWWVVTFRVRAEGKRDKVEFNLLLK